MLLEKNQKHKQTTLQRKNLFQWIISNFREYVNENFFVGMKVNDPKVHKHRDGFTAVELKVIFKPTNFEEIKIMKLKIDWEIYV